MRFIIPSKDGLYYLHVLQIRCKPGMTEIIYKINYNKKLKDNEEETNKKNKKIVLIPKASKYQY